jgi:predicted N-formylglutamate amidohydrolase
VRTAARAGRVLHIAVHSFAPVLDGAVRNADIGLLYAPGRRLEAALAARLHHAIARIEPDLRVRRNYPYRGGEFGLTEWLRRQFPAPSYVGFEIECNQGLLQAPATWRATRRAIVAALREAIGNDTPAGAVRR